MEMVASANIESSTGQWMGRVGSRDWWNGIGPMVSPKAPQFGHGRSRSPLIATAILAATFMPAAITVVAATMVSTYGNHDATGN
jgi:hypothetical protein